MIEKHEVDNKVAAVLRAGEAEEQLIKVLTKLEEKPLPRCPEYITPGNWFIEQKGEWAYIYSDHDGTCVAIVSPKETRAETTADANVLSAAKDLLGACEYAMSILELIPGRYIQSFEEEILDNGIDWNRIQLAIAKAKGEGGGRQCGTIITESL